MPDTQNKHAAIVEINVLSGEKHFELFERESMKVFLGATMLFLLISGYRFRKIFNLSRPADCRGYCLF